MPETMSHHTTPISPLGPLKVAVTVDDMLLFRGVPYAPGYSARGNTHAFVEAFRQHGVQGVYQFSNTAPAQLDTGLLKVFDDWVEQGHHVANHTHNHPSLNWLSAKDYARDIEKAERVLDPWLKAAPMRCFRFCMDMWGDTACKCDEILDYLGQKEYTPIPVSVGFHDFRWHAAHFRVIRHGSREDLDALRQRYVDSAVRELRVHAANARAVFGKDPAHIWLIHGTPIAADCLSRILGAFRDAGVQFISLEEAMRDPMNAERPPRLSPEFIFQVEKWALAKGVPVNDLHPRILEEIETLYPMPGESAADITVAMREAIAQGSGAIVQPIPSSSDQLHP
jgi:peptidoglycan/xylan/chitin deacetylase (PgdA/CDA1 family)